jgi:protein N-terminal methyltransferase
MLATEEESNEAMISKSYYTDAAEYWAGVESTDNGMLGLATKLITGGFSHLDAPDVLDSTKFIQPFLSSLPSLKLACGMYQFDNTKDCGAGIGRVSQNFLLNHFEQVDLVEQDEKFLNKARDTVFTGELANRVDRFIALGLQDFTPEPERYDLIWCQWYIEIKF